MRTVRWVALSLVVYLVVGLLGGPVAAAAELDLLGLKKPEPVPTAAATQRTLARPDQTARHNGETAKGAWPKPGTTRISVPRTRGGTGRGHAGSLPVQLTRPSSQRSASAGPDQARVQVLDQKAAQALGIDGVLVAVEPVAGAAGTVDLRIDYSGFRNAIGGDWASRLTLRQLPACALTTPQAKGCGTTTALRAVNDTDRASVSAPVALPPASTMSAASTGDGQETTPVVKAAASERSATGLSASGQSVLLAVTAAASGASGDFKATSLAPSASWAAGGSNGGFTWTYDIDTPEVPGGLEPDLSLAYSSQSVDGRTAATNNQANWIGDGWSMEPGYIERRYIPCTDDTKNSNATGKVGDQCWKKENAVLNLGGHTSVLVKDDSVKDDPEGEWRLESDDGTKAVKLTSANRGNGDNDGEYWRVTTPDGTRYYFGYNRLPGWAEGKPETNSTWTVPVFGNQSGEPCHAAAFKDSWCQQAWRWNLDYVVDPHSDAMAYYWEKETNSYGLNVNDTTGASTATEYTRGGYLKRIEYGLRSNTMYGKKAAGKVDFTVSERCLSTCGTFDKANAKNWPDVPFDQYCAPGTECKDRYSPSYWSRKRLTQIDTSVLTGGAYLAVDTWKLAHDFPATGDGTDPALWLKSIARTGHTGTGDVTLPSVTFKGQQLANRVEGATTGGSADPVPPLVRYRVYGIDTETGGTIGVTYSAADCKAGSVPAPSSNTRRCYPVMWSPPDAPGTGYEPYLDWFHSYVVTQVLESDNTGGAPVRQTDYAYLDGLAWAKSKDDEFTQAKHLTYDDRKGYGRVQVRTGAGADQRTLKEYRYFRGIDGAQVKDEEGIAVTDREAFAGMTREEAVFDGDGGKLITATSYEPWRSAATATESRSEGLPAVRAYATGMAGEKTRTAVGAGRRTTQTNRTFDAYGQVVTESRLGDTARTGDEECTTTTYNRNTGSNLLNLASEIRTVAKACGTTPALPADLVSVARYYYDGATSLTTAPTKGDVTRLDEQDAAGTGYLTTATTSYDQHGRELTETDALGRKNTVVYTPATVEPPTSMTETNSLGHTTTVEYDPARGTTTATVDANGKRADAVHDGLGRVLKVWGTGWTKADHATQPSTEFTYTVSKSAPNAVATKSLQYDGSYATSYVLYDGLLRERQTQAPAIGTKDRVVTETHYDTRGFVWKTYAPYYATGAPSKTLVNGADNKIPAATETLYDGVGRETAAISRTFGDEKWRTTTLYDGDRTTVIPPKGGTATTVVTDALGRTTERLEYTNAARTTSQKTAYTYGKYDEPSVVTDPAGNTWTYTFDSRGQQIAADDPDKGASTTVYDKLGQPTSTTDARGVTLTRSYDELGRATELKQGSTLLAKWSYDTVAKGQPAAGSRYLDGKEYRTATDAYDDRYQPTSTTVTVPSQAGALAGSYTWTFGYNAYTGQQEWIRHPAVGNLPSERQTTIYSEGNLPQKTTAGSITLVNSTAHDVFSRPVRIEYGTLGKKVYTSRVYDEHTGRMTRQTTDRDLAPQRIDDTSYAYDPAGNITGITTAGGQDAAKTVDTQCFTTDPLGRLSEAWTAKSACTTAPSSTTVGGPDPYWQTYGYDSLGNRTQLVEHATGTQSGSDATTTYTHPAAKTGLPHAVRQTKTTGGPDNGRTSTFAYDKAGNTTERAIGSRTQKLTWDAEGHLATLTESGATSSYAYDADGNRMITKDADGSQTLTLPGGNELKATSTGAKEAVRYYTHEGETVAVRTGSGFSFLLSDHQGTAMAAVGMTTLALTRRKQLPFGQTRTEQTEQIPGTRGFVGGTNDPTGLTHLGAREYDPTLGRFLSVDPVIDFDDPAQMNAYSYAHNNPVTQSDPTGLRPDGPAGGATYRDDYWADQRGMNAGYTLGKNGKWTWKQTPKKDKASQKKYAAYKANPSTYKVYHYNPNTAAKAKAEAAARAKARAADEAQAAKAARKKAEAERRKKDGIWGNIGRGISRAWNNTTDFVHNHQTALGWVGVGLGVASMITPLGAIATGAMIASFALGAITTADSCISKQWGSCAIGVTSLGLAGAALGAARVASSASREASGAWIPKRLGLQAVSAIMRFGSHNLNIQSIAWTFAGTVSGGRMTDKN
ncbi:RHS repeat-associated core domain-containing protein [Streptomyces sp. NPDC093085]|uniref:RHS repeat domain-containing protein n=1 Tax=Streptomyces sp. NPDC093085 TaxID=3155068 RepID=UPI003439624D